MNKEQERIGAWCRTIGINLAAILVVVAIAGAFFYRTANRDEGRRVAVKPGGRPDANPPRGRGVGPVTHGGRSTAPTGSKTAGSGSPRRGRDTNARGGVEDLARREEVAPRGGGDLAREASPPGESTPAAGESDSKPLPKEEPGALASATRTDPSNSQSAGKNPGAAPALGKEERRKAEARFRKVVGDLHTKLHSPGSESAERRAKAEADLNEIDDPLAVPAIWRFLAGNTEHHNLLSRMLARIDSPESTKMLAALSVYSSDEKARRLAANALRKRDPADFVESLISVFNSPMQFRVVPMDIPGQDSAQVLVVEGERIDYQFLYPAPEKPSPPGVSPGVYTAENPYTYLSREERAIAQEYNRKQTQMAREMTAAQLKEDIAAVKRLNDRVKEMNGRAVGILREATGQYLEPDREQWKRWLTQRQGRRYVPPRSVPKPTMAQIVPPLYSPTFIQVAAPT